MTTMTRDELRDRLTELKQEDWPRFSLDMVGGAGIDPGVGGRALLSAAETPEYVPIIDSYLRHFVPGDCPSCGHGMFGWGVANGSGTCSCGWPGTVYHYIVDDREIDSLVCRATCNGVDVCGRPRGEHEWHESHWFSVDTGEPSILRELRCPDPTAPPGLSHYTPENPFTSRYHPPRIADFQTLLWVHPYEVHLRPER